MRKKEMEALKKARMRATLDYNNKFNRENYKNYSFRLNTSTEADLIEFLENFDQRKEYFVTLIRKDMKRLNKRKKASDGKDSE